MPVFNSSALLSDLKKNVSNQLLKVEDLQSIIDSLNKQPAPDKWSVAQVIEHLNSYNRYYLPEIEKSLSKKVSHNPVFKSGIFGNYFTNMMAPKGQTIGNKMASPKDHVPKSDLESPKVLSEFIKGQNRLLNLLLQAEKADIGKLRVPISISRFIKLKLGDTFRFLIAHQQRHFVQIDNTLAALGVSALKQPQSADI